MALRRQWMVLASLFVLVGCASTRMTSMVNPEWNHTPYTRILVFYPSDDLDSRQLVEDRFESRVKVEGVDFVPAREVLFPGRTYSEQDLKSALEDRGIDAILVIRQGKAGYSTAVLPGSANSSTRCTTWSSSQGCVSTETTTTQTGGGTVRKPWSEFSLVLVDFATYQTGWVATARSRGNAFADAEDLVNSMVEKAVSQLIRDGVLERHR